MSEHTPEDPFKKLFSDLDGSTPDILAEHSAREKLIDELFSIIHNLGVGRAIALGRLKNMYDTADSSAVALAIDMFNEGEQRVIKDVFINNTERAEQLLLRLDWSRETIMAATDEIAFSGYLENGNNLLRVESDQVIHVETIGQTDKHEFVYRFEKPLKDSPTNIVLNDTIFHPSSEGERDIQRQRTEDYLEAHDLRALKDLIEMIAPKLTEYYLDVRGLQIKDNSDLIEPIQELLRRTDELTKLSSQALEHSSDIYPLASQEADEFYISYAAHSKVMEGLFGRLGWAIPDDSRSLQGVGDAAEDQIKSPLSFPKHLVALHEFGDELFVYRRDDQDEISVEITRGGNTEYRPATLDEIRALSTMVDIVKPGYMRRYEVIIEQGKEDGE